MIYCVEKARLGISDQNECVFMKLTFAMLCNFIILVAVY